MRDEQAGRDFLRKRLLHAKERIEAQKKIVDYSISKIIDMERSSILIAALIRLHRISRKKLSSFDRIHEYNTLTMDRRFYTSSRQEFARLSHRRSNNFRK